MPICDVGEYDRGDSERTRRRTDAETGDLSTGASLTTAVFELWLAWVVAVVAIVLAVYFSINDDVLITGSERLLALLCRMWRSVVFDVRRQFAGFDHRLQRVVVHARQW